jgi:hypothetical protein
MSTPASAVTTVVDSAPAPAALPELSSLTPEQRQTWRDTGDLPSSQDSAPAPKEQKDAVADSAPQKDSQKPAVSASDSATDKDTQKPHKKPEDYGEKRFQELANENKSLKSRLEALERKPSDEKRENKQPSQAAVEEYKPLDEKKYFADNPKATYEDFVRAAAKHEAKWESRQEIEKAIAGERQRIAQEAASKEFKVKVQDAEQRYGKEEAHKIFPAIDSIVSDPQIPLAVKAMLDASDVLVDLMYVLATDEAGVKGFTDLCKSNPAAAIRKLVTTEALVQEQLKGGSGKSPAERGEDGKFKKAAASEADSEKAKKPGESAPPITAAPRPPVEVGGRSSAPEDGARAAVLANDWHAVKREFHRQYAADHK